MNKFLYGIKSGWGRLNTMHILLIYLQKASPEKCPLLATILLQLDLLVIQILCKRTQKNLLVELLIF